MDIKWFLFIQNLRGILIELAQNNKLPFNHRNIFSKYPVPMKIDLKNKLNKIPIDPGVYQFSNTKQIIYIGKVKT